MFRTFLALALALAATASAQAANATAQPDLPSQLPGNYSYIDVMSLLRVDTTNALILDIVCPKTLTFNLTNTTTADPTTPTFSLHIYPDYSTNRECRIQPQAPLTAAFQRNLVAAPADPNATVTRSLPTSGNVTIQQVYNSYPLYLANVTDKPLICPLLQTQSPATTLVLHDLAYLYSFLNHYRNSNASLGARFASTPVSNIEPAAGRYYLSIRIAAPDAYVCTYTLTRDRAALVDAVSAYLNPDVSPAPSPSAPSTPAASMSPSVPPATASPTSSPACFPADARAVRADGSTVPMSQLRVGDRVRDASGGVSPVLLFTHADRSPTARAFVTLRTPASTTVTSHGHLVPVRGRGLVRAAEVRVGDRVSIMSRAGTQVEAPITEVGAEVHRGLFNPQTASGTIAVVWQGAPVVMSAYTDAVPPGAAHAALAAVRGWCAASEDAGAGVGCGFGGRLLSKWLAQGSALWPRYAAAVVRAYK